MNEIIAYEFEGLTFCPKCALINSNLGLLMVGHQIHTSMDDVIAAMTLIQIENGMEICTPVGVVSTNVTECENCHKALTKQEV